MNKKNFEGKSLNVIGDFSIDEQAHLYEMTRQLKEAIKNKNDKLINNFRINDKDFGIYDVFLEDSTRTSESFKNAADFLNVKFNQLNVEHSSFNKSESYADGFNMLTGYNNGIFVVRSKVEGLCRWLEKNGKEYAERNNTAPPAFINAGDGKHEHPTQELLDEFTFREDNNWKKEHIHVALIGDLLHGRTVHSKAQGLNLFKEVEVDLIAPPLLAMPNKYIQDMKKNGYEIRIFESMEEYVAQKKLAPKRYFTRPQLERMGEEILKQQHELIEAISFHEEGLVIVQKQHPDFKFYHPLPQHKKNPTIPQSIMKTKFNGVEKQAANGYPKRIVLLSAIAGNKHINESFNGEPNPVIGYDDDFHKEMKTSGEGGKRVSEGINPIKNGIVIDHICRGQSEEEITKYLHKIVNALKFYGRGGTWISESKKMPGTYKGILFRPNGELSEADIRKIACIVPECTVNIIKNSQIEQKLKLHMPSIIEGIDETHCKSEACISHPVHAEQVPAEFLKTGEDTCVCRYCDTPHNFKEILKL